MLSHLIFFLLGAFTGAAGKYLADRYTDQRRSQELTTQLYKQFVDVSSKMPTLIEEMQDDLNSPDLAVIREFYIIRNKRVSFFGKDKETYFVYYEEKHDNLIHKVNLLENNGFVYDVSSTRTPKYRMTENFVELILMSKIENGVVKI